MSKSDTATGDIMAEGYFEAFDYVQQFGWEKAKSFLDTETAGGIGLSKHTFYLGWSKYLLDTVSASKTLEKQSLELISQADKMKMH